MKDMRIVTKSLLIVLVLLAIVFSITSAFSFFGFVFNPSNKGLLQFFIVSTIACTALWGSVFYLAKTDKTKTEEDKLNELKNIVIKLPMIVVSVIITSIYTFIYFMFFGFMTTSEYGKGGWAGDNSGLILAIIFFLIVISIFGMVMYNLFKTERQDLKMTLYNQFMVLKWSSIIALPFGFWSVYYFYRDKGASAWFAMFLWMIILYAVYKTFARLSDKVHESIIDANVAKIIHEKRKHVETSSSEKKTDQQNIADELKKFKELLNEGAITQDEFELQKRKLLK